MAHGLGFASFVQLDTGESLGGRSNPFLSHVFDSSAGLDWGQMTLAQRRESVVNLGGVSWTGEHVRALVEKDLGRGIPMLRLSPELAGFEGWIADAAIGPRTASGAVSGPVRIADPPTACPGVRDALGAIFVTER